MINKAPSEYPSQMKKKLLMISTLVCAALHYNFHNLFIQLYNIKIPDFKTLQHTNIASNHFYYLNNLKLDDFLNSYIHFRITTPFSNLLIQAITLL